MSLNEFLKKVKEGQFAMATFGGETWFVIMSNGFIRYCNYDGGFIRDTISLTPSTINAEYKFKN
jgi:hypothetical protein